MRAVFLLLLLAVVSTYAALCTSGKYSYNGQSPCSSCSGGTYCSGSGCTSCTKCPCGKYSGSGASSCSSCYSGSYCGGSGGCSSCAACSGGTTSGSSACSCTTCPTGQSTLTASTFSGSSIPGYPSGNWPNDGNAYTGASTCRYCPPGTYRGSVNHCYNCPGGRYNANAPVGDSLSSCPICPAGTFSSSCAGVFKYATCRGPHACTTCAKGSWAAAQSSSCTLCPAGQTTSGTGATSSSQCFTVTTPTPVTPAPTPAPTPVPTLEPTPEPTPEPMKIDYCEMEPCVNKRCANAGDVYMIAVVGSNNGANAWGSGTYSDDTYVGTAAVHAGFGSVGDTITVKVTCAGPQTSFTGSTANGVTTQSYTAWEASFTFEKGDVQAPPKDDKGVCVGMCLKDRCTAGTVMKVTVRGTLYGYLYGTNTYSDDSWPSTAAVHAGAVDVGETKKIAITCTGSVESLTGSTQNGVTSKSWGAWPSAYVIAGDTTITDPPAETCVDRCVYNKCLTTGLQKQMIVTGTLSGDVWGTDYFTDDSFVGAAAVFEGKLSVGQTATLLLICTGSRASFTGGTANGVTTMDYTQWPFSFVFG